MERKRFVATKEVLDKIRAFVMNEIKTTEWKESFDTKTVFSKSTVKLAKEYRIMSPIVMRKLLDDVLLDILGKTFDDIIKDRYYRIFYLLTVGKGELFLKLRTTPKFSAYNRLFKENDCDIEKTIAVIYKKRANRIEKVRQNAGLNKGSHSPISTELIECIRDIYSKNPNMKIQSIYELCYSRGFKDLKGSCIRYVLNKYIDGYEPRRKCGCSIANQNGVDIYLVIDEVIQFVKDNPKISYDKIRSKFDLNVSTIRFSQILREKGIFRNAHSIKNQKYRWYHDSLGAAYDELLSGYKNYSDETINEGIAVNEMLIERLELEIEERKDFIKKYRAEIKEKEKVLKIRERMVEYSKEREW
jgi:hypothetical protein